MQFLFDVFVVLIVLIWQIFNVVDFANQEDPLEKALILKKPQQYDVVVGILSARANFEQRQALRDTWVGHATRNVQARLLVKFIVASQPCMVPPQDRLDSYTCEPDVVVNPVLDKDIIAYNVTSRTSGAQSHSGYSGMDFRVNAPVVITHLGVCDTGSEGLTNHGSKAVLYNRLSHVKELIDILCSVPGLLATLEFQKINQIEQSIKQYGAVL